MLGVLRLAIRGRPVDAHTWALLAGLAVIYAALNVEFGAGITMSYLVRPALWMGFAWMVSTFPHAKTSLPRRYVITLVEVAALVGAFQVCISVLLGVADGFGKNPVSLNIVGLIVNMWMLASEVLGMEISRAWFIGTSSRKEEEAFWIAASTFLYTFLTISLTSFGQIVDKGALVRFVGGKLLPVLAENLLCSCLAVAGGWIPAVTYKAVWLLFWWFSPVVPDLSWIMMAYVQTVVPIIGVVLVEAVMVASRGRAWRAKAYKEAAQVLALALVSMVAIWFAVGMFPVYPVVIATGSMVPVIEPGDIVLAEKDRTGIEVGDVIEFRKGDIWVFHRVVEVVQDANGVLYRTKGDANPDADLEVVRPSDIRGRMIRVVPKLGKLSLGVKKLIAH